MVDYIAESLQTMSKQLNWKGLDSSVIIIIFFPEKLIRALYK